ncbi:MAG: NAD(P)/FAD-dependent oxidoreductase [Candidatus Margulisiibacteriota bacterium]|nr:NAD(P)/FAD-dependent oxidoreductase [Candidatus Margulisiibacteriota bacterium]
MTNQHFDLVIIGGGPAGLMAAGVAAECGAKVVLLEKNERPGKKLLISGKGRCNITTAETDPATIIESFGKNGKFLYSAFHKFSVQDTIDFFNQRGVATKVERGQRIFPVSDRASDVLQALVDWLKEKKVKIITNCAVHKLVTKGKAIEKVKTSQGDFSANKFVVTTGGKAAPSTGSSGDGYAWAGTLGHKIIDPQPSLVPVRTKESWAKDLEGLSLKNARISVYQHGKKRDERFGEAIFTHDGLSGPIILDMSQKIGELLEHGEVELSLDFKPALEFPKLDSRIQRDWLAISNKMFKNSLDKLLPQKLIPVAIKLSGIDPDKKVNAITKEERNKLLHLLKEMTLKVRSLLGFERAIATAGGINLKEIEPKTMRSKLIKNLYFAGEIIDLNGPTGGFNLQMCWSTGYLAGKQAAETPVR